MIRERFVVMAEFARGQDGGRVARGGGAWLNVSPQVVACLVAAVSVFWMGRLFGGGEPAGGTWGVQVVVTAAALAGGVVAWRGHRRRWRRPARALAELLPAVQRGEAAVEQLADLDAGELKPIACLVVGLVRELRQQRTATAELENEIRQRVANRTDALERTIGTLRQQATRDALTGLFNRRFLDQYLPQCVQRHLKEHRDLCLLMLDLDNFKLLNDTLGHAAGDDLLRDVGQLIRSTARGDDVAFRCGGDEFVVLLPGYGADAGLILGDRLSSLVDALGRTLKVPAAPRLAIGIASLADVSDPTPSGLLKEADRRLYAVKRSRKGVAREGLHAPAAPVQSPPPSRRTGDPFHSQVPAAG
jgi:diguanylate cyclase (GGDEF)-like protein